MRRVGRALVVGLVAVPLLAGVLPVADADDGEVAFTFSDDRIDESSGLVLMGGLAVTVNDSGDSARVFVVDPATGETVGVTSWAGDPMDDEALAPLDKDEVWVGDIGDNYTVRDHVTVTRVKVARGDHDLGTEPHSYDLVYPDGAHDAETLMWDPTSKRLYVVVKEFIGRVYAAPAHLDPDGPNTLQPVGDAAGIATDGAIFPDGKHAVIRNYGQAVYYTWPALERITTVKLPQQGQGETIAVSADGTQVWIGSEGVGADVLRLQVPDEVFAARAPTDGVSGVTGSTPVTPDRPVWPWLTGGLVAALGIAVLLRSLRPR